MVSEICLDEIRKYIPETKREGMAGFSEKAKYYGVFNAENELTGFTSLQFYTNKVKFNNHFVLKQHRGKGYFKQLFDFSIQQAVALGYKTVVATCTDMSIKEYLKRGATVTKRWKKYTEVKLEL